jgi:hypothetical protein
MILLVFLQSCTINDSNTSQEIKEELRFDYSVFKHLNEGKENIKISISRTQNYSLSEKQAILDSINNFYGTNVYFPDSLLNLINNTDGEIKEVSLSNNWISEAELTIYDSFVSDLGNLSFDNAITNFENTILENNPNPEDFKKYNSFANSIKYINYQNPGYFDLNQTRGWFACAYATATFTASSVAVGLACVPNPTSPLSCPLAVSLSVSAYANMIYQCVTASQENP